MTSQEFIRAWGGDYADNPLARFRQALQNLRGYGELVLEEATEDGFRPAAAPALEEICSECRVLMRHHGEYLALSGTFEQATANLYHGLLPTVDAVLGRLGRLIETSGREPFGEDLRRMRTAGQGLRDLLVEVLRRGGGRVPGG